MSEQWRPIPDWPYEASSQGRIRRNGGQPLAGYRDKKGYVHLVLCNSGKQWNTLVHRLVCAAFYGPPPASDYHADHKNGIRDDNRSANLRWLSRSENLSLRKIARGEDGSGAVLTEKQARAIKKTKYVRGTYSILASEYGVGRKTISDILQGKTWRHL